MGDILGNFKKAEGAAKAAPATSQSSIESGDLTRGANMIDQLGAKQSGSTTAASVDPTIAESTTSASSTGEQTRTDNSVVNEPGEWTKDSALKEVKKLRDENKAVRLKYQEQVERLKAEQDARAEAQRQELEQLKTAQVELDRIKADQEDKKRDLSERIAHREAKLAEMQALMQAKDKEYQNKISNLETIAKQYQAEREAENEVYKSRISEEINKIPEKFRDYANLIVKGSGDSRDALLALNEAKLKGMFEEKTVVVNHSVPGANDGARSSKERLEEAGRAQRSSMNSSQKIKTALQEMRSGQKNSAFRQK